MENLDHQRSLDSLIKRVLNRASKAQNFWKGRNTHLKYRSAKILQRLPFLNAFTEFFNTMTNYSTVKHFK